MCYLDLPIIDGHIHVHTNDVDNLRVSSLKRHEEINDEIFKKTNDEAIVYVACGYSGGYHEEKSGHVNLVDTAIGYYLKDKCPQKIYLFGAFSREFHKPEKISKEYYLEQAKFRVAAGCDGFKSLDGLLDTYRKVGVKFSDPVTDLYFDYLEKNNIPIVIHMKGPDSAVSDEKSGYYVGKDRVEECKKMIADIDSDVEELLTKFPKLTLILPHFYFMSHRLDKAEEIMQKWDNVYFDLTPNICMFYDFNKIPDNEMRAFFKRNENKILYGTDTFIEEGIGEIPIQVNVVRDYFEKDNSELLSQMGIKTLPMDEEFLKKIYYENMLGLVGDEPKPVDKKKAIIECNCLLEEYKEYLSEKDLAFVKEIKAYFENGER